MTAIRKIAAGFLAAALLVGGSATAASAANLESASTAPVVTESAPLTKADVAAAKAAFKNAQIGAQTAEKQARATAAAELKSLSKKAKLAKGKAVKAAQLEVKNLRAAQAAALKKLRVENRVIVGQARAAFQAIAAAYEAQLAVEAPVVEEPAA